jgi:hypothetical protein
VRTAISLRDYRNGVEGVSSEEGNQALILSFFPLLFNTMPVYDGYSFAANIMGLRRLTPPVHPLPLSRAA